MAWETDLANPVARATLRVSRGRNIAPPPRRRAHMPAKPSAIMLPWLLLSYRSRVFMWTLVLSSVIVARLLFTRMEEAPLLPSEQQSKELRCRKELQALRTGLEWFRAHCKRYPTEAEGLRALVRDPGVAGWHGYYVNQLPPDPWGHPYLYGYTNEAVVLRGMGPDGVDGTADDIASPEADWRELLERVNVRDLPRWGSNAAPAAATSP